MTFVSATASEFMRQRRRALEVVLVALVGISVAGCADDAATEAAVWSPLGGPRGFITSFAVSPGKPAIIYATVRDRGLFKSTDSGRSWSRPANIGLEPDLDVQGNPVVGKYSVYGVAVDPHMPMTVYAINRSDVVKSTDGGRHWRAVAGVGELGGSPEALAINPQRPDTVYAAGWSGVAKTTDGGRTWRDASAGLPEDFLTSVALDPRHPERLYVGTEDGDLWKTTNGGHSWGSAGTPTYEGAEVSAFAFDPHEPETIYAGTWGGGISKSTDVDPWEAADTGLPGESEIDDVLDVYALALDPRSPGVIYAAVREGGVFRSKDAGKSWHSFNEGLENRLVYHLAFGAGGRVLYAGTSKGVFAYSLAG